MAKSASEPFPGGTKLAREDAGAALSLFFRSGERPDAAELERALGDTPSGRAVARISHRPEGEPSWVELLASGLTLEAKGLAPAASLGTAIPEIQYGFDQPIASGSLEAVAITPGPHLASAHAMQPVVRAICEIAARLCRPLDVQAVGYAPSQTLMEPGYFERLTEGWLGGGAFPALGLTALVPGSDGSVRSQGLAHFLGLELQLQPATGDSPPDTTKAAIRLVDYLMRSGVPSESQRIEVAEREAIFVEPSRFGNLLLAWRGA